MDFEAASRVLPKAYAGYADKQRLLGPETLARAAAKANEGVDRVQSVEECDELFREWLKVFRDGHVVLGVPRARRPPAPGRKEQALRTPGFSALPGSTALLTLPSFNGQHAAEIRRLLEANAPRLRELEQLIIDVRGNGGGNDSSFEPLVPWLYTGPIREVGVDVLVTPESIEAWRLTLSEVPAGEVALRDEVSKMIERMSAAPGGTFMSLVEDHVTTLPSVEPRPRQVFIIVDKGCGSSCEQFLLTARQSTKVRLIGTPTAGVLDYSNIRPFVLPSDDKRALVLATTRTRRGPSELVDGRGIIPDVTLDPRLVETLDASALVERARQNLADLCGQTPR